MTTNMTPMEPDIHDPDTRFDKVAWSKKLQTVEWSVLSGYISSRIAHLRTRMETVKTLDELNELKGRIAELRELQRLPTLQTEIDQRIKPHLYA